MLLSLLRLPVVAALVVLAFGRGSTAFSMTAPLSATQVDKMEATVRRYFEGVNQKDPEMIRSCFGDQATIRDVCALNAGNDPNKGSVPAETLVERCMDFLTAHPGECLISYGTCRSYGAPVLSRLTAPNVYYRYGSRLLLRPRVRSQLELGGGPLV